MINLLRDEQEISDYLDLINALIDCPTGEELDILNDHRSLVDEALIQTMEKVAVELEAEAELETAKWLYNAASDIKEIIQKWSELARREDYLDFLLQVLEAIDDSEADPEVVYPLLEANLDKLNEDLAWILQNWATETLAEVDSEEADSIAADIGSFSILIQEFTLGEIASNIEIAITGYKIVAKVLNREEYPEEWWLTQHNLGFAYYNRIAGNRSRNLEKAIDCYQSALSAYNVTENPEEWGLTQNNLGLAYLNRIEGDSAENEESAIAAFQSALQVRSRENFPKEWAETQNNLGLLYFHRTEGDTSDNIERAISYYQAALSAYPKEANPAVWAMIQNNLGLAYYNRIEGEKGENIESAIAAFQAALEVRNYEEFPIEWAGILYNLGSAYLQRNYGFFGNNLEMAIANFTSALKIYIYDVFPLAWAKIKSDLGLAYSDRILGYQAENLEIAIALYQEALQVYTAEDFPEKWAEIQNALALIYIDRIEGEEEENVAIALDYCQNALQVYSLEEYPEEWAMVQNSLGMAYRQIRQGEKAENIEKGIDCYKAALQIYSREESSEDWAMMQNNLGNAYCDRLYGEKLENLKEAVLCFCRVLEVYTRDAFPKDWAMAQNNLALAYYEQGKVDEAIACFRSALEICTPSTFPYDCLQYAGNLGDKAFAAGSWTEAIEGYSIAIEVIELTRTWVDTESRRQEILKEDIDVYENIIQACINNKQLDLAIEYVERSRSRRIVDLMASNDLYSGGEIPLKIQEYLQKFEILQQRIDQERLGQRNFGKNHALTRKETTAGIDIQNSTRKRAALTAINETIATLETEKQQIWQELRRLDPVLAGQIQVTAPNLLSIQQLIEQPTTAFVSFYTTTKNTSIFVIRQNKITCHICHNQSPKILQDWINQNWFNPYMVSCDPMKSTQEQRDLKAAWISQIPSFLEQLAERLQLDELINQHLTDIEEIIIVPHLYLHQIPFAALPTGNGQYLGDKFLIRYTPSCQVLEFCQQRPSIDSTLTYGIVEDATEDLPCASFEAEQIAQLYNIAEEQRLRGRSQATVNNYRQLAKQVQAIVSSHHAQSRLDNPLESRLELADGSITLGQLMTPGWRMPHLSDVFLSCCETGLGVTEITDDILTLSTGFLCAGARSVVSTLWAVDDLATALFSIFYHQKRQQGYNRPESLQQAQVTLRTLTGEQLKTNYYTQLLELLEQKFEQAENSRQEAEDHLNVYQKNSAEYLEWQQEEEKRATVATRIYNALERLEILCVQDFPFSHPFYWAAFTCSGLR